MELSNLLPAAGKQARSVNAQLLLAHDGQSMRLSLSLDQAEKYEAAFTYRSPLTDRDAADTRWLLEDHPRLRGRSSDPIAARIEKRLHELAADLRQTVFESTEATQPIREALADPELLRRLHVVVEEPATASWTPWELMLAPASNEPLSVLVASFSRLSTSASRPASAPNSDRLRVLLVTCRPSGEDDVPFRSVASRIVQAVAASPETAIQVDVLRPPTYDALLDALAAANKTDAPYNVVHFDGHGAYDADLLDPSRKRGYLYFEGLDGSAEEVSGSVLGADLARHKVNYLLLNACRSAYAEPSATGGEIVAKPTEEAFGALAAEIRAEGVAGVLAMGFNLYVVTAAKLVAGTYAALAAGRSLSEAVTHARRELYHGADTVAGTFNWLVPIAFSGETIAESDQRKAISDLSIQASTTTPVSAGVIDPGAVDGPRSDEHPFFGYDEILLRLDRACGASRSVELIGLAGAGKSAVAGEFARWWVATTPDAAVVVDVNSFASFAEFNAQFEKQWAEAQEQTSGACLVVLEGASTILDPDSEVWSTANRVALQDWIEQQIESSVWLLLTGRAPSGLSYLETITLNGLDTESRAELATHVGFDPEQARGFPGMLRWTQGVPIVVKHLPMIVEGLPKGDRRAVRKLLSGLRAGKVQAHLGITLIQRSGLEFFNASRSRGTTVVFALGLFNCYVTDQQWQTFASSVEMKVNALDLGGGGNHSAKLKEEMRRATHAGLASRTPHGYLLHPLAPIAIDPVFAGVLQLKTGGNQELMSGLVWALYIAYIQSVQVTVSLAEMLSGVRAFGDLRLQRENLTNAVELAVLGAIWGLALPLLHKLRGALLAESREEEWREILNEVFLRLKESPPREEEMGPENAELHIVRLLAEEAERYGDEEQRRYLRELQLRVAYADDKTIERVGGEGEENEEVLDVGRIRRIAGLLKRGDAAASDNSPECLAFYNEALRLAEEGKDMLRVGEIHYALARTYINVEDLYNPAKYESHAREAIKAAHDLGPFGSDLYVRASVSLGNAIVIQQLFLEQPDPERLKEAREALLLGVTSDDVSPIVRGTAHNGLGNLYRVEGDMQAAADEYLAACKEYEAAGDTHSLRTAQANAAFALNAIGRGEDARSLAAKAHSPES